MALLKQALKDTFGDPSIVWRAPMLGLAAVTGVGAAFSFGYAFALQDYVASGGDEHPEVDMEYLWYGLRFSVAVLLLLVPAYVLTGSLAMPALLDVGEAGLTGLDVAAAWEVASARLTLYALLVGSWTLVLIMAMPALMTAFVETGGRFWSALDPVGAWRVFRRDPTIHGSALVLTVVWITLTVGIYAPAVALSPLDSLVPWFVGAFVVLPLSMAFLLSLQRLIGLSRRLRRDRDGVGRHGWEHLEAQDPGTGPDGPDETPASPQATGETTA